MAMNAWKSPVYTHVPKKSDTSFPGLTPSSPELSNKIEYAELQENEVLALEAIYGEDFVNHTSEQTAWKVIHIML